MNKNDKEVADSSAPIRVTDMPKVKDHRGNINNVKLRRYSTKEVGMRKGL